MADPTPPPRPKGMLMTFATFAVVIFIISNESLRIMMGTYLDYALNPLIGFNGRFPVLTLMLAGAIMVLATTIVRHLTTDWVAQEKFRMHQRHFQREMLKARKENNTFKLKKLQDQQPEMLRRSQEANQKQMKTMPITMLVVVPLFAWMSLFVSRLDYGYYSAPWNPAVDMFSSNGIIFGSSLLPHWILLYSALSVPVGSILAKWLKVRRFKLSDVPGAPPEAPQA